MKNPRSIIKTLLISEKSLRSRDVNNAYVFEVAKHASKIDIKNAIEKLYHVRVEKVTTQNNPGKMRRLGRFRPGYTPEWKKAVVKIKEGETIQEFETF